MASYKKSENVFLRTHSRNSRWQGAHIRWKGSYFTCAALAMDEAQRSILQVSQFKLLILNLLQAMTHLKIILLLFVTVVFATADAIAGLSDPRLDQDRELPVNVTADQLQYSDSNDILTAEGNVLITQGTRSIKADTIRINLVTNETEARGGVLLTQDGDTIACESFTINLDTQVGVVHQAKIFIKDENLHISGRDVQKTGLNTYKVHDGTITTCDADNPPWRIDAAEIDVEVEGYAVARHPLFRVKSVPVMYLPALIVPVKLKRQTGFLIPEVGHSNRSGFLLDNSFFWAINNQSDATFWLDTATKRGFGTGLEYRVKLAEQTDAKLYGYFADETNRYQDDRYRNILDREDQRYYVNFEGQHYFDADTYLKADVSQISDRQFYYDYKSVVQRSKGVVDRSGSRNYDKEESTVFLNKNFEKSNLLVNMNWYRNLRNSDDRIIQNQLDDETVQTLPQVLYSSMLQPVTHTPLFYQLEAGYDNFWRESGQRSQRLTMYPQLAMPMLFGSWLRFKPKAGMRGVQFFGLNRSDDNERNDVFPTVDANLATSFARVFNLEGQRLKKLRHIIEPGLEYAYVADDEQSNFPDFDRPDNYYRRHWAGYYLQNRFTALMHDAPGELTEHEIGYVKVGQLFNFTQPRQGLYYKGDRDTTSSDIFSELRLDMHRSFYFKAKAYYDNYDQRLRRYNLMGRLSGSRNDFISLEYRYWRELYDYLECRTYFNVTSWLALFANTRYDFYDYDDNGPPGPPDPPDRNNYDELIDSEFGIEYHSQCWGLRFWYETEGSTPDTRSDSSVRAMFFIKGFGDRTFF